MEDDLDLIRTINKIQVLTNHISSGIKRFQFCNSQLEILEERKIRVIEEESTETTTVEIPEEMAQSLISLQDQIRNRILNESLVIQIFSFFEETIICICDFIEKNMNPKVTLETSSGSILNKAHKYYKDNLEFLDNDIPIWQKIDDFRLVRNTIVHNHSKVNLNSKESSYEHSKYLAVLRSEWIMIENNGKFNISDQKYFEDTLDRCLEYLNFILDKIISTLETLETEEADQTE